MELIVIIVSNKKGSYRTNSPRQYQNDEYAAVLREEVATVIARERWTKAAVGKMFRLDSFLRETTRLSEMLDSEFAVDGSIVFSSLAKKLAPPYGAHPWRVQLCGDVACVLRRSEF
jgi:hypothetical protein